MLKMFVIIVIVGIAALVIALAVILIRFNRKRLHIIRCAKTATSQQLESIYSEVESLSSERASCAVLARTNRRGNNTADWLVPVPPYIKVWADRVISVTVGEDVTFRFAASTASEPILRGEFYRILPVPRHLTKSGKTRNQFSPARYAANNPQLLRTLEAVCPVYPVELLAFLLAVGAETFEFNAMNQVRIGGTPAWVQAAEFPNCDECKKRMSLILQLPGSLLPGKPQAEGTFYFFGCTVHLDKTKTVTQFA